MKKIQRIAFIDPFLVSPAAHCFNGLVDLLNVPMVYYMPDKLGIQALLSDAPKIDAYFVGGSASNVTEPLSWHAPLAEFLVSELKSGKPMMGACFGHQILCHAFGSVVEDHYESGEKIKGLRPITLTQDFGRFRKGDTYQLPVTHKQTVKSLGSDLISVGLGLPNDMVIHKSLPMLTTQAHPEASLYFCAHDIGTLNNDEVSIGTRDGQRLLKTFFESF